MNNHSYHASIADRPEPAAWSSTRSSPKAASRPASRKLNLSQPAVSHALARLRDVFGEPLFERQGRGIVADAARALDCRARCGRRSARWSARSARLRGSNRRQPSGTSGIGLREALEPSVLPDTEPGRSAPSGPRVEPRCRRGIDRPRLETDLAAGEFDVALDVLLPVADRVPHERVLTDRLVVIARKDHSAAASHAAQRLEPGRLPRTRARAGVVAPARPRRWRTLRLQSLGRARRIRLRCQSHAAACRAAASTDLVATIAGDVCAPRARAATRTRSWRCRSTASTSRPTCTGRRMRTGCGQPLAARPGAQRIRHGGRRALIPAPAARPTVAAIAASSARARARRCRSASRSRATARGRSCACSHAA